MTARCCAEPQINFCTSSHVHFDFDAAMRTQLVSIGGRQPYEWVKIAAADTPAPDNPAASYGSRQPALHTPCSQAAHMPRAQSNGGF